MAKLSKQEMVQELIELYGSDPAVRDHIIGQIKQEIQRTNDALGLGPVDWDFMRFGDAAYARNPDVYFRRLMEYHYSTRNYKTVLSNYNDNFKVSAN